MKKNIQHNVSTLLLCASLSLISACTSQNTTKTSQMETGDNTNQDNLKSGTITIAYEDRQITYSGAYLIDGKEVQIDGGTYESSIANQNVFLVVNGGKLTIKNATIKKGQESANGASEDSFSYGINAGIVVLGENSKATITNCNMETKSTNSDAVYTANNANVKMIQSEVLLYEENSNGVVSTYGSLAEVKDTSITTKKKNSTPIKNVKEGKSIRVQGGTLTSYAKNSPSVYTEGDVTLKNVRGSANRTESIIIEKNSKIVLKKCNLNGHGIKFLQKEEAYVKDFITNMEIYKSAIQNNSNKALFSLFNTNAFITIEDSSLKNSNSKLINVATTSEDIISKLTFNANTQNLSGDVNTSGNSFVEMNLKSSIMNGEYDSSVTINQK